MNAFVIARSHRFLPLLAIGILLTGLTPRARAEMLRSHLTNRTALALILPSVDSLTPHVVYDSQGEKRIEMSVGKRSRSSLLTALALTLIIPAGTMAVNTGAPSPPPPPPPPPPSPPPPPPPPPPPATSSSPSAPPDGGGGAISGGPPSAGTPEPATLVLALTGGGAAMLSLLRRRRLTRRLATLLRGAANQE